MTPHPNLEIDWFQLQVRLDGILKLVLDEVRMWCVECNWVVRNRTCSVQNKSLIALPWTLTLTRAVAGWSHAGYGLRTADPQDPCQGGYNIVSFQRDRSQPPQCHSMNFNDVFLLFLIFVKIPMMYSYYCYHSTFSRVKDLQSAQSFTLGFSFRGSATRFSLQQRGQRRCHGNLWWFLVSKFASN